MAGCTVDDAVVAVVDFARNSMEQAAEFWRIPLRRMSNHSLQQLQTILR